MTPEPGHRIVDLERAGPVRAPAGPLASPSEEEPTLGDYLATVSDGRWLIIGSLAAALAAALLYLVLAAPVFRSDVVLQVEDRAKGLAGLQDLDFLSDKTQAEAEVEILRSRSLVGAVVDQLSLAIEARPRTFPFLGGAFLRRWSGDGLRPPLLGLSSWAWGGERIRLDRLELPEQLLGERLELVALGDARYRLLDPDGATLLEGSVGKGAEAGEGDSRVALFVSELRGRAGARFAVARQRRGLLVEQLQGDLRIAERGKKTGILSAALEGTDRRRIATILDAVAQTYVRQNVERKSAEAEKTLAFIESQLPQLKSNLDQAEEHLNVYRAKRGQVDLSLETKGALDRAVEIEKALTELSLQRSELRQRFTESHPLLAALQQKVEKLQTDKAAVERRMKLLPEAELDSARLMRDVKTATELYFLLLNKAQELRVLRSGTIGNVRILDPAVLPEKPVAPRGGVTLALALLGGLGAGLGLAFGRKALDRGVSDPDEIERALGLAAYASVPHSARQEALHRKAGRHHPEGRPLLAAIEPADLAVESLRSLRTSLQFSLLEAGNNVVVIGGPSPSVGKSFIAANLGHLLGDAGKRVLLADADLRRGRLHLYFGGAREPGLADAIAGASALADVTRKTSSPNVDFIPTGRIPSNPSELLGSERFRQLVAQMASHYDVVLLDTAPILAVTDGALVARLAGVNMLVLRAGHHPMREVSLALKRFRQNGSTVHGAILNDVRPSMGGAARYHYQYEYRSED